MAKRIQSFEQFQELVINLFKIVVQKGDANGAANQATIKELSAGLTTANEKIKELTAALETKDAEKASAIAAEQSKAIDALDTLSTKLETEFNPTVVADSVAEAIKESSIIETPVTIENATTLGTSEITPREVVATAIDAIDSTIAEVAASM